MDAPLPRGVRRERCEEPLRAMNGERHYANASARNPTLMWHQRVRELLPYTLYKHARCKIDKGYAAKAARLIRKGQLPGTRTIAKAVCAMRQQARPRSLPLRAADSV